VTLSGHVARKDLPEGALMCRGLKADACRRPHDALPTTRSWDIAARPSAGLSGSASL
jgi:hypothetical protein